MNSVTAAQTVINPSTTPVEYTSATSQTGTMLNFMDIGGGGHFNSSASSGDDLADYAFPGMTVGQGGATYVLQGQTNRNQ